MNAKEAFEKSTKYDVIIYLRGSMETVDELIRIAHDHGHDYDFVETESPRGEKMIEFWSYCEDSSCEAMASRVHVIIRTTFDTESSDQEFDLQMAPKMESKLIEQIQSEIADYAAKESEDWIGFLDDTAWYSVSQWLKDNDYFVLADLLASNEDFRNKFWAKFDVRYPEFST